MVIDDCWSVKGGRDGNGDLVPDPAKFPDGIKALADHVHSLGLKLGIYSDAAEMTCANYPGSYGFEAQDASLWASWGIDFLKYDYCHAPDDQATAVERYGNMGEALRKTGREFLYSLCEWGGRALTSGGEVWEGICGERLRMSSIAGRMSGRVEIQGSMGVGWTRRWISLTTCTNMAVRRVERPRHAGNWSEGTGPHPRWRHDDFLEYQTHMSIWCMACSPLMMTCDVRTMDPETATLLMNREVLAVNQDPLGKPARCVKRLAVARCGGNRSLTALSLSLSSIAGRWGAISR